MLLLSISLYDIVLKTLYLIRSVYVLSVNDNAIEQRVYHVSLNVNLHMHVVFLTL